METSTNRFLFVLHRELRERKGKCANSGKPVSSPRAWFERFSGAMVEIGFRRCHADYSVFIKRRAEGTTVLLVYVEDIVLTGDDGKSIKELKAYLGHQRDWRTKRLIGYRSSSI